MKHLAIILCFISFASFAQSGTISFKQDTTKSIRVEETVRTDIKIYDESGKVVAFKEYGKPWIVYDPKKAVEVLFKLLREEQKRNATSSFRLYTN